MAASQRLTASHGALLVVDLQEKLLARMAERAVVVANAVRLVKAAELLRIPVVATEQYPTGLGPTVAPLAELIPERHSKLTFHAAGAPPLLERLHGQGIRHVTVVGIEAHVCVAQTALELMNLGFVVQVPADAVTSRHRVDWEFAVRRLECAGVVVSTTESALFEWTETADRPNFKQLSGLVKGRDADLPHL